MNKQDSISGRLLRLAGRISLVVVVLIAVAFLVVFRGALYNRYFVFPQQDACWERIRESRVEVSMPGDIPWTHYRGTAHNHSELSHDSEMSFEDILQVLKDLNHDFIAMTDHCLPGGVADFGAQWRGLHDGKLFIPGYEMRYGFLVWGLEDDVVLDCTMETESLAAEIDDMGGLLFIGHPEESRDWSLSQIRGMEIYNIHAAFQSKPLMDLIPDILLNFRAYPEHTVRLIFDRNTEILDLWDQLNLERDIAGIAGNDCHQNIGFYGIYTQDGDLIIRDASGKDEQKRSLNSLTRYLLRLVSGPLIPGNEVFRVQLDPYELMTRFVVTYALAADLTEEDILDAIASGRVYIGFDMIADSKGFILLARNKRDQVVMGESIQLDSSTKLIAASPHHCRFTVLRHGEPVHRDTGYEIEWQPGKPGKYRVEAELLIRNEWVPWVYTNPIEIHCGNVAMDK